MTEKKLKFGLALPYGSARQAAELARIAEAAGWDGIYLGDAVWTEDPMISLAASAMVTERIRLGIRLIPAPLRHPWKIASEAIALDHLSGGRLTLGLGAGAVWMGWQGFPDAVTDTMARAEMLDETIDILTFMLQSKQVDYDGKHFHLKLSLVDENYYPPQSLQKPCIPLWVAGIWPRKNSMRRILKCDGIFPEKLNRDGSPAEITPADIAAIKTYVGDNRALETPFDIVIEGRTAGLDASEMEAQLTPWIEAGITWWVEGLIEADERSVQARIEQGPPEI